MSNVQDENENEKSFFIDCAKQGRATCKKCKQKCQTGEIRIAKLAPNPFGSGKMKNWHHVDCIFEQFLKQKVTTKRIECLDDLDGCNTISEEDRNMLIEKIEECNRMLQAKYGSKIIPEKTNKQVLSQNINPVASTSRTVNNTGNGMHKDCLFKTFRKLVADISSASSYLEKTKIVHQMFTGGSDGAGFKDDIILWCKLLLPGVVKRIYNIHNKQLIKLFSRIFDTDQSDMMEYFEQGDIGETIQHFFEQSKKVQPSSKSKLTVKEIDEFLEELSELTKEEEQINHFKNIISKLTSNDLKTIIRLIRHDLRMNAGAKHILQGVHADAYEVYQSTRDIELVINKYLGSSSNSSNEAIVINETKAVKASVNVMIPCLPMLAEACKSLEQAIVKCPNGLYSEIKYDGERVQVHKKGSEFKYFSRSLKPVLAHKIIHFKEYIPKAFPHGNDLILDSEILMIDAKSGKILPFGTLGVHKKNHFKDATVCMFVFDCIYYNGEVLTNKPLKERKEILKKSMTEIPNRIMFSEMQEIHDINKLSEMMASILKQGLEGLVLKDICSIYEPGKRHWLKLKKDYLFQGAMADSADLIVLGAWYGTGKKGGMMSIFLMGCYDECTKKFYTVTKVHTGHDDKTLERLQSELDIIKISCDQAKVPNWLECSKTMVPDFIARDPKKQPVWEITGAEFTRHEVHTADGISIRFPRVTKIRDDKSWDTATNLQELQKLFKNSKENTDISLLLANSQTNSNDNNSSSRSPKKRNAVSQNAGVKKLKQSPSEEIKQSGSRKLYFNPSTTHSPKTDVVIKNPLPDYFKGVKLLIEKGIQEEHYKWLRYFIAFGGIAIDPEEWEGATQMLHLTNSSRTLLPPEVNIIHSTVEWLRDSVLKQDLLNPDIYPVYLEPGYLILNHANEVCESFL